MLQPPDFHRPCSEVFQKGSQFHCFPEHLEVLCKHSWSVQLVFSDPSTMLVSTPWWKSLNIFLTLAIDEVLSCAAAVGGAVVNLLSTRTCWFSLRSTKRCPSFSKVFSNWIRRRQLFSRQEVAVVVVVVSVVLCRDYSPSAKLIWTSSTSQKTSWSNHLFSFRVRDHSISLGVASLELLLKCGVPWNRLKFCVQSSFVHPDWSHHMVHCWIYLLLRWWNKSMCLKMEIWSKPIWFPLL